MITKFRAHAVALAVAAALASVHADAADEKKRGMSTEDVEKISVIGTRAAPRSAADSAVPVDIIDASEFANQGPSDMVDMLQNLVPSFNVNDQPINDAATLVRPANLRGLASDHTLILVNGKRRHRSAVITFLGGGLSDGAQGPDISVIPAAAIKQVDVLRDGAAAQYGSDAIAGVINFTLKNSSEGGLLEAKYGQFYEGDGEGVQLGGNIGLPLTENGFANFSFEYKQSDPTSRSVQRDDAQALIDAGNTFIAAPAQIWGAPEFKDDLKIYLNTGLDLGDGTEVYMFGNVAKRDVEGGFYFRNPQTRGGIYDGGLKPTGELDANGNPVMAATLLVGDLTPDDGISCPTVFITPNVLTSAAYQLVANDPNCFAFNELLPGGFTPNFGGKITDTSLVLGTKGEFGDEVFYDVSLAHGRNEAKYKIRNTINPSMGPDTPRQFSPGKFIQQEDMINIDLSKLYEFEGLDEPVNVAGGFEYRNESFESISGDPASFEVGPLATQGFGIGSNGFPGSPASAAGKTSRNSFALYLDIESNLTDTFLLAGAVRYEDFSDFGDTTKGKISARWEFMEDWAVRGAISNGFKAPTIGQTTVRNVTTAFASVDDGQGGTVTRLIDRATLPPTHPISVKKGATPLTPEESESYSIGLVGQFDNGLFVTIDYFHIEVTDRISTTSGITLTPEDIEDLLGEGVIDASSFSEISYFTNDFDTTTQGVDVVMHYEMAMFGGDTNFALAYNWTRTEVDRASDNVSSFRIQMLEDNLPPVRYSLTANHTNGAWRLLSRVRYAGATFEDHLDAGLPFNAGSEVVIDAEVGYTLSDNWNFVLGATNLFDEEPDRIIPWDTEGAGSKFPTTAPIGINGGYYYVRAIYSF